MTDAIQNLDFSLLNGIQELLQCGFMDKLMPVVSLIGGGFIWCIFGVLFLFFKEFRFNGIRLITAFTITVLLTEFVIKPLFMRERPFTLNEDFILLVSQPYGSSFPSAHSSSSFAAAVQFFGVNRKSGTAAVIFAVLVAFSRLYLYVHFPTDVLAGTGIGIIMGIAVFITTDRIRKRITDKKQVTV